MTAEHFEAAIDPLMAVRPFKPFTIELTTGQRIEIDHPGVLLWEDAAAIFRVPGGRTLVMFDHDGVNQIITGPAHAAPGKRRSK